jgi:hypothetical protein
MTLIPIFSVTFHGPRGVHVELFDREADAIARGEAVAADGLYARVAYHEMAVGRPVARRATNVKRPV